MFGGQHCEEILITQGRIVWEEIVKPVLGWLRRGFWAPTEQVLQILIEIDMNYTYIYKNTSFSSYRAVNTLRLSYTNQSVNVV